MAGSDKISNERFCKHCKHSKQEHHTSLYKCDLDWLPLDFQEMWYTFDGILLPTFEEMDNLEYLEWKDKENEHKQ